MLFVGNIIKETTRRSYNKRCSIHTNREVKLVEQDRVLSELIQMAKLTSFGIQHDFDEIDGAHFALPLFQSKVPLTDYEAFHDKWLKRSLTGEANIIWPGKINFYALSSGTSSDASKRIPVSENMIRQFQKISFEQIISLHNLELPSAFFDSKVLIVGGSTQLKKCENYYEGDLSGILAKNKSLAYSPFTKPKKKIAKISDWNKKMNAIVEKAPKWDIGAIAGAPTWVSILLGNIIETHKLDTIHDIWPNLEIYSHGGVFLDPYKEKLDSFFGKKVIYQNTFLASEGYFGYQEDPMSNGMKLLTNKGVYYEFIEEKHFDKYKADDLQSIPTIGLDRVKEDIRYGMVISTSSGLWRYVLGDVIRFTNTNDFKFNIEGRIKSSINVVGEHLIEGNMMNAIQRTASSLGVSVEEFCVYPSKNKKRHNWYIGSNQKIDCNQFSVILNSYLEELNDDYKHARKHILQSPRIKALPIEKFYEYLAHKDKLGGQHKFPRVMTKDQAMHWEIFLTRADV